MTTFEAALNDVRRGLDSLDRTLAGLQTAATNALRPWWVPRPVRTTITRTVAGITVDLRKVINTAKWMVPGYVEAQSILSPFHLYGVANDWVGPHVRGKATMVVSELSDPTGRGLGMDDAIWTGAAANAYRAAIGPQVRAATYVGDTVPVAARAHLNECGNALLALYVAVGLVILQILVAASAAVASFVAVLLAPLGLTAAAVSTTISVATLLGVLGAFITFVASLVRSFGNLAQIRNNNIPWGEGGRWPNLRDSADDRGYNSESWLQDTSHASNRQLNAAYDGLRRDQAIWSDCARDMGAVGVYIEHRLTLDIDHGLPALIAFGGDYNSFCRWVATKYSEAAEAMTRIQSALGDSRAALDQLDGMADSRIDHNRR